MESTPIKQPEAEPQPESEKSYSIEEEIKVIHGNVTRVSSGLRTYVSSHPSSIMVQLVTPFTSSPGHFQYYCGNSSLLSLLQYPKFFDFTTSVFSRNASKLDEFARDKIVCDCIWTSQVHKGHDTCIGLITLPNRQDIVSFKMREFKKSVILNGTHEIVEVSLCLDMSETLVEMLRMQGHEDVEWMGAIVIRKY
jgi:hypothetical protein